MFAWLQPGPSVSTSKAVVPKGTRAMVPKGMPGPVAMKKQDGMLVPEGMLPFLRCFTCWKIGNYRLVILGNWLGGPTSERKKQYKTQNKQKNILFRFVWPFKDLHEPLVWLPNIPFPIMFFVCLFSRKKNLYHRYYEFKGPCI